MLTWADVCALPKLWKMDIRRRLARLALDYIGDDIKLEMFFRRSADRAKKSGENVYCLFHDCCASQCPPGEHE